MASDEPPDGVDEPFDDEEEAVGLVSTKPDAETTTRPSSPASRPLGLGLVVAALLVGIALGVLGANYEAILAAVQTALGTPAPITPAPVGVVDPPPSAHEWFAFPTPPLFDAYSAFHAGELAKGAAEGRFLASVPVAAGFADRIIGAVNEFWCAFFSERAFQVITGYDLPPFEAALTQPNIRWLRANDTQEPTDIEAALVEPLRITYRGSRRYTGNRTYDPAVISPSRYHPYFEINRQDRVGLYSSADMRRFPFVDPPVQSVFMSSNRGRTYRMARDNYHLKPTFEQLGTRPETAFADAFHYLFRPTPAVVQQFEPTWVALDQPRTLRISVNIRVGDHVFDPARDQKTRLEDYEYFFRCARQIEEFAFPPPMRGMPKSMAHAPANSSSSSSSSNSSSSLLPAYPPPRVDRIVWYLTSDSLQLRTLAQAKYGAKILTDTSTPYVHGDCLAEKSKQKSGCGQDKAVDSIVQAVGQIYAMSMCDYHIYKPKTGFARVGAWLSRRSRHLFTLADRNQTCTRADIKEHEVDAEKWAGI